VSGRSDPFTRDPFTRDPLTRDPLTRDPLTLPSPQRGEGCGAQKGLG
jgi:hypothetical protein